MKSGIAYEFFVKQLLINVGFSEVPSDGLYIYDGAPGQMIQGFATAHNADVLLEPPVQTPFYSQTRFLIECKDYQHKVGLNTIRSVLGLREDINHFNIINMAELQLRRQNTRPGILQHSTRYSYQVALAAISGFTANAQRFAMAYHIPLIEFTKMPFWADFEQLIHHSMDYNANDEETKDRIRNLASSLGNQLAIAVTNQGQLLFLFRQNGNSTAFDDEYTLHWSSPEDPWILQSNNISYSFQLPDEVLKTWLNNSQDEMERRINALQCKERFFSSMVVYYKKYGRVNIKMLSIDQHQLTEAKKQLEQYRID